MFFSPFFYRLHNNIAPKNIFFCCKSLLAAYKLQYNAIKNHFPSVTFQRRKSFSHKKIGYQYPVSNLFTENDHFLLCNFLCDLFAKFHFFAMMYDIKYNFLFFILHNFDYFHVYISQTFVRKFHQVFGCIFNCSADDTICCLYNGVIHGIQCCINSFACAD